MANHVFIFDTVDGRFIVRPGTFVTRGAGKKMRIRNFSRGPVTIASASPNWAFGPVSIGFDEVLDLGLAVLDPGVYEYEVRDVNGHTAEGNSSPSIIIDD